MSITSVALNITFMAQLKILVTQDDFLVKQDDNQPLYLQYTCDEQVEYQMQKKTESLWCSTRWGTITHHDPQEEHATLPFSCKENSNVQRCPNSMV